MDDGSYADYKCYGLWALIVDHDPELLLNRG